MQRQSPHRLVIPFTALLAVVLTVVLFKALYEHVGAEHAVYIAAASAFALTALIGLAFKPMLGE
jgi:succinate dehydrogenase hydrophobic anchor subunit